MSRTTISSKLFNQSLKSISKNIVVKNAFEAKKEEKGKADPLNVDKYLSASKFLQTKFSTAFIISSIIEGEDINTQNSYYYSQIYKLESGIDITIMPCPTVEESIEYYKKLIEENNKRLQEIVSINGTANESERTAMKIMLSYIEYNNYYLMLSGHPDYESDDTSRVFIFSKEFNEIMPIDILPYQERVRWVESKEGKKFIKENSPKKKFKYLNFLTDKKIYPFIAREAGRFQLLYCPPSDPTILKDDFISIYNRCLNYIIRVYYSDAYRVTEPELYEGFIGMSILFTTIGEMYYKYLEADITRDFYDLDSLRVVYEAYGVPFYDIIPLKFHKKIIKNINRLIQYKGSNQVFFDLCDIFEYDILGIYQYYLFKERKLDKNNDPYVIWKTVDGNPIEYDENNKPKNVPYDIQGNPVLEPDLQAMYDVYFVRANINNERFTQIIDPANKLTYDSIVSRDNFWLQFDPDTVKTIYENEYNFIETKYIGVQLMFNLTELLWESSYFMGMLRDNRSKINNNKFLIEHERMGAFVPLFDFLIYIIALICKKRGYSGEIRSLFYKVDENGNYLNSEGEITTDPEEFIPTPTKTSRILGFNFKSLMKGIAALQDPFGKDISNMEKSKRGLHIKKDFEEGEEFHPFDLEVGNDFFHGNYIQDWIQKNRAFFKSDESKNFVTRMFAKKSDSNSEAKTAYFENLHITTLEDVSRAFKAMKNMKLDLDTILYNTHDREEFNALKDLQRLLYTTEIIEEVFQDNKTGELSISYYTLLESLNPQLASRYNEIEDINTELDYCLLQLQNLCDELKYMIYIDQLDIDVITEYLYKMLEFFKSAKADLTDFNVVFYISDRTENCLKLLEKMHSIIVNIWIDDRFKDLYDSIYKITNFEKIEDRSIFFKFIMELVPSLSNKKIFIEDGWESNIFSDYKILESTKINPFNIDTLTDMKNQNFVSTAITGENLPDELLDERTRMRPYQISNKIIDSRLEQIVYTPPYHYKRKLINNSWTEFEAEKKGDLSLYIVDRISELRNPYNTKFDYPVKDSFNNIGLCDNIRKISLLNIQKDGLILKDKLIKIK